MDSTSSLEKLISEWIFKYKPKLSRCLSVFFFIILGVLITSINPALAIYITIGLIGAIIGLIRPKFGLFIYIVIVPCADFFKRLSLISLPVSQFTWNLIIFVPDIILICSVIGVLLFVLFHKPVNQYDQLDLVVSIFFAWQLFSILNPNLPIIVSLAGFKLSALYMLLYFLARTTIRTWKDIKNTSIFIILSAIFPTLYGFYQFIFGMTSFEKTWLEGGYTMLHKETLLMFGVLRPFSTFSDPGSFSHFLAIIFLLLIFPFSIERRQYMKFFILFSQGVTLLILIATIVRAGWILSAISILVFVMLSNRKHIRIVPWLVWVTLIAVPILGKSFQQLNIGSLTNFPFLQRALVTGTFYNRVLGWQNFLSNPKYRPIFGNGLGAVGSAAFKFGILNVDLPHNQFLTILYEVGLIGLFLFVLVVIIFYRTSIKLLNLKYPDHVNTWIKIIIGIITGLLVMGASVSEFLFLRVTASYFWLFMGLLPRKYHSAQSSSG